MIGAGDGNRRLKKTVPRPELPKKTVCSTPDLQELRSRAQQLSLREQLERNHFLLKRLYAGSARLVQTLEHGDAYEAVAEIIGNMIGSEEVAIFRYVADGEVFSLQWSWGIDANTLQPFASGAGMLGRAVHNATSQFRNRQDKNLLLPHEKNLTACIVLKSGQRVIGAIAMFGLLPQKNCLEWVDFELLKFLEVYGSAALQFLWLEDKQENP